MVPLDRVARCWAGNFRSGKLLAIGTPLLRSTLRAVVLYFGSTFGNTNGAGVPAGASASSLRTPGFTVNTWLGLVSQAAPASRTCAGVALATASSESRKQPGLFS